MDRIKLHDKTFRICIPNSKILDSIEKVANQIDKDYKEDDKPIFLSVLNGSFMFVAELMQRLSIQAEISFVKLSSYSGTHTTGTVNEIIGLNKDIKGRNIIIVEDIVDTGVTVEKLHQILIEKGAKDIKICTLLLKPDAYKKDLTIDYSAITIPNDFIVGYGLDYDELGRQYKDIYVLES